ncbi:hypothetical protein GCM10022252_79440 [Streptosporangium oxazolinicum]|uniref:Uncharacterized protein n=1 Tax=Streptosporangium oxazolinicum TaxID=909287 RepID=A0ABP8BNA7_9ACTN
MFFTSTGVGNRRFIASGPFHSWMAWSHPHIDGAASMMFPLEINGFQASTTASPHPPVRGPRHAVVDPQAGKGQPRPVALSMRDDVTVLLEWWKVSHKKVSGSMPSTTALMTGVASPAGVRDTGRTGVSVVIGLPA